MTNPSRVLWIFVCGAGPANRVGTLVTLAQDDGWDVHIIATPAGAGFIDVEALEKQTGNPVRTGHRPAAERRSSGRPVPDAIIVAPASYNTINKLAHGTADTYALDLLSENIGRGTPTVILPFVNSALANRRPFRHAIEELRAEGVRVLFGPGEWEPHEPGVGAARLDSFPWSRALHQLD
ncbi:flavoprotein [Fodinicola acaciae]|uniref:flavoprotein n=1 Tax=Fodinicola acaciae TaxID=2681555 RepID=UPI001C9E4B47|nr:flavoprotein [Fodinicola acaciae]